MVVEKIFRVRGFFLLRVERKQRYHIFFYFGQKEKAVSASFSTPAQADLKESQILRFIYTKNSKNIRMPAIFSTTSRTIS